MKKYTTKFFTVVLAIVMAISMLLFAGCKDNKLTVPDEYNYDDLSKYIKLADYKNVEYDEVKVSDEKITSGVATEDCIANIDYVGSVDGKEFDGGAAEGYDLDLDNSNFISGFAEAIVGHSVGENFDINVTFPEDYQSEDLAGKDAVFNITLNYLKKGAQSEEEAQSANQTAVSKQIVKNSKIVKYPETELKARTESLGSEDQAKEQVKNELVLHAIAQKEGLSLSESDYNKFGEDLLSNAGISEDQFESSYGMSFAEYANQNNLYASFLYQKVMEKVMEYSVAK